MSLPSMADAHPSCRHYRVPAVSPRSPTLSGRGQHEQLAAWIVGLSLAVGSPHVHAQQPSLSDKHLAEASVGPL